MKKGQFFIMSIVLLALALFILMNYALTIDRSSIVMFESNANIDAQNILNAIQIGNRNNNSCTPINMCNALEQTFNGRNVQFNCSTTGSGPYNYTISLNTLNLNLVANITTNLTCAN